jgi:cell division protein FtsB
MNYFLLLVVLVLGAVGYYEYTNLEQENATDDQEIVDLKGKIDNLEKENKTLDADKAQLAKDMSTAEAEVANLTGEAKALTATPETSSSTPATPKPKPLPSNNLGNITTLDQKTYQNCQLLKVEAEDIVISDSDGITQIAYTLMAPDLQKRFGYDPHVAATLFPAQVELLEEQRKASAAQASSP